ncbi:MAG: MarR family winged helix-turn-helix transcriptional regulator [Acetobacteraceae bacterium]
MITTIWFEPTTVKCYLLNMREPKSVADLVSYRLLRLSNTLGLYSGRRYRQQFDVTLPEWRVLSIIALHDTTTARDISRILAMDKGWVGLSVEKLRRRGFLVSSSDERDTRKNLLSLTEEGRKAHDTIMAIARWRQRRLLAALPRGTTDTLIASLDRLQAEADRMLEELDASLIQASSSSR